MAKNIAVILGGGKGIRMGYEMPKQFMKIAGKSVIEHTIDAFQNHEQIDEIAIVVNSSYAHVVEQCILDNEWTKVKKILNGGDERSHSSLSAINAYKSDEDVNLIFHDAVRPLVSSRIISDNIKALEQYDAIDTAIASADTIIQVDESMQAIFDIPNRDFLKKGQTPQSFKLETIKKAYEIALKDPDFKVTDDCGVVKKYLPETKIFVVKGEEQNIKLTYKEDIYLLDKLFQLKSSVIDDCPDFARLKNKVIVVFGGRMGIGAAIVSLCEESGIKVYSFSRKLNNIDIRNASDIQNALKEVYSKENRIDCVINTAAVLYREPLIGTANDGVDEIIDINLKGVINISLESYNYLKESKGHLLFFTSSSYTRGRAFYTLYSATKAAIVNFVQGVASEWESSDICVNCINPERTKTPMRLSNFGIEPEGSLLEAEVVAKKSLAVLCTRLTGQVCDVKRQQ